MVNTKTKEEIALMKKAGKIAYDLLEYMEGIIRVGITTNEINDLSDKFIRERGGIPSSLGYEGYPKSVCVSVNDEVVHGIASKRTLKDGDIVTIDLVVTYEGYMADTARTYAVGKVDEETLNLLKWTKEALYKGISKVKEGVKLNEVSKAIESVALEHNLGVVRELTGHGIGKEMHEDPYVYNYSNNESELELKEGMTFAIEPMFTLGKRDVWLLDDDWTIVTQDGKNSAHFEHTIAVTKEGYEILTGE